MAEVKIIGQMDNTLDHTFESANRVYDKNNLCPTLNTCGGGQLQPKVIEETRCVGGLSMSKWGTQYHQQDRVYKGDLHNLPICQKAAINTLWQVEEETWRIQATERKVHQWNRD